MTNKRTISLGSRVTQFSSVQNFLDRTTEPPNGDIEINQGLPLHMHWTGGHPDTTLVMFSGATPRRVTTVPAYEGYKTTRDLAANVLLVSDPSIILNREMTIGWYAGHNRTNDFQTELHQIITSLAGTSRIIYFGTSGGGFPALEQASRTKGSTALVVNPLTHVNIERRDVVDLYLQEAWSMTNPEDPHAVPFVNSLIPIYKNQLDTSVVCIHNKRDYRHIKHYWNPFIQSMHSENRVATFMPDLGAGHVPPDRATMRRLFELVTTTANFADLVRTIEATPLTRDE